MRYRKKPVVIEAYQTDKAAIIIMAKAIWIILNLIVRKIDKEGSK